MDGLGAIVALTLMYYPCPGYGLVAKQRRLRCILSRERDLFASFEGDALQECQDLFVSSGRQDCARIDVKFDLCSYEEVAVDGYTTDKDRQEMRAIAVREDA